MSVKHAELRDWHDWTDPDFFAEGRQTEQRFLPLFLRQILPGRIQRTKLTITGWMLIIVAMGIGSAAYNTASNILFMTLSLLLSSLVLSGILSLINFKKLFWELKAPEHLQVGEVGVAEVGLINRKTVFPTMSICFHVGSSDASKGIQEMKARRGGVSAGRTPFTDEKRSTSEHATIGGMALHLRTASQEMGLHMMNALPAGQSAQLEWTFTPQRRGPCQIYLQGAQSKFPFGFLNKSIGEKQEHVILVWPARVGYRFFPEAAGRRYLSGVSKRSTGLGSDLLNIREYTPGDPPRLIHWKATARVNKLMVRQLAQEGEGGFHLEVEGDDVLWSGEQFEKLCSVACSLADDLFHAGRLDSVRVSGGERTAIRSMRDLHGFFDSLASLEPGKAEQMQAEDNAAYNRITFRPLGESAVAIYVDDLQAGQTDD